MTENVKQAMAELVERLSDDCTWDDVMYQVYVRQKIEAGLEDAENDRMVPHDEVFEEFQQ
jgi:predicted transcriptional regulator